MIGGSVAGLHAARKLAAGGASVTLFERSNSLSPAPRTLIVTNEMNSILGPLGESSIVNRIDRFDLFADGEVASIALTRPDLVIERSTLIRSLAKAARHDGVDLRLGRRLAALDQDSDGVRLRFSKKGTETDELGSVDAVVGADGAFSDTARVAGWPRQPVVSLVQTIVPLPTDMDPATTRVWFRPDDTAYFYWLIPENESSGVLGLIGERRAATVGHLDRFATELGLDHGGYQAAMIPAYRRWIRAHRKVGPGDVYLIGDAAGHVKVSTVGGIVTGLRGAEGVAAGILRGTLNGELRSLKRELNAHLAIRRALNRFTEDDYRSLIDHIDKGARDVLGSITRDDAPRILLKVLRTRPQMILRGLRALLVGGSERRRSVPR